MDSNQRPRAYEFPALASELRRHQTITCSSACALRAAQAYSYSGTVLAGWARVRRICFSGHRSTPPHTEQTSAGTLSNTTT